MTAASSLASDTTFSRRLEHLLDEPVHRGLAPEPEPHAETEPFARGLRRGTSASLLAMFDSAGRGRLERSLPPLGASPSGPEEPDGLELGLALLRGMPGLPADPTLLLLQLGSQIADQASHAQRSAVEAQRGIQAEAAEHRQEAMAAAARAARRAERWARHRPPWVQKLVKAITLTAGIVGAAFTGGSSLGLAIAGTVLMCASKHIVNLAVRLGMDPERAQWLGLACQIAGAALMAGVGSAGGGMLSSLTSATTAARAAELAGRVGEVVSSVAQVAAGVRQVGTAVNEHRADEAELAGDAQSLRIEISEETMKQIVEEMQQTLETLRDSRERLLEIHGTDQRTSMETAAAIGR